MFGSSSTQYSSLPGDPSAIPPRQQPPVRPTRSLRRGLIIIGATLALILIGGGLESRQPESRTQELLKSTGLVKPDLGLGRISKHRELVSVVLNVGNNDHGILEVMRSLLAMTVGPYELIGVFNEPSDQSQRIADILVRHHIDSKVDRLGRGLKRYRAINATDSTGFGLSGAMRGLHEAKGNYLAILNADDQVNEYGWDRILLTAVKSDPSLLAVSGRAAANIAHKDDNIVFSDILGQLGRKDHDAMPNKEPIEIRNVAIGSPIMYDAKKAKEMDWMDPEMEIDGLGNLEMCLKGASQGYKCGFYPVATKTNEEWKAVPGSLPNVTDSMIEIPARIRGKFKYLGKDVQAVKSQITAITREVEDIPKTIVTAFSGNHQHTVQQWYKTLHQSPHTRFIAYILPSDVAVDPETYASWTGVEVRVFDFSCWPEWMNVTKARGEYAWKGVIVEEVIRDYGGLVFWMDAGNEIADDFTQTWREVAELGLFSISVGGPISMWTHPGTVAYLSLPPGIMDGNNCNGAMWAANSQHFDAMNKVIRPYIDCVKVRECVAPLGSNRSNHRQDQAALSSLIHLHGYKCDSHAPIRMGGDAPGDGSKFCETPEGNWVEC